jgi:hypothetical protein
VGNPSWPADGSQRAAHAWLVQGQLLEQVQQYKYLGIIFDVVKGIGMAAEPLVQKSQPLLPCL